MKQRVSGLAAGTAEIVWYGQEEGTWKNVYVHFSLGPIAGCPSPGRRASSEESDEPKRNKNLRIFLFLFFFLIYWRIVDLQCCDFNYTAKQFSYIYYILFHVLFHHGLSRDIEYSSLLCSRTLLSIHSIYNSSHLLIPNSQYFLPHPRPPWQPQVHSLCLWVCFCFIDMFIYVLNST